MSKAAAANIRDFASLLKPVQSTDPAKAAREKLTAMYGDVLEEIKSEARREAYEAAYAIGFNTGRQEGYDVGKQEGSAKAYDDVAERKQQELTMLLDDLNQIPRRADDALHTWFSAAEPKLAELSALIATRLLSRELELGADTVTSVTKEAIGEVTHSISARIKVNPADVGILQQHREELLGLAPSLRDIQIIEDSHIQGGCLIETEGGVIDATLESKFNAIWAELRSNG